MQAVKWQDWKIHFYDQVNFWDHPIQNGTPKLYNLTTDPKEEWHLGTLQHTWVFVGAGRIASEFQESVKNYPPIPMGTPDPYVPQPK